MALFHHGLSRPPKTQRRRRWLAVGVLLFCALIGPFVVLGAVQGWKDLDDVPGAIVMTLLALICLTGVVAAIWALVDSHRHRRSRARRS